MEPFDESVESSFGHRDSASNDEQIARWRCQDSKQDWKAAQAAFRPKIYTSQENHWKTKKKVDQSWDTSQKDGNQHLWYRLIFWFAVFQLWFLTWLARCWLEREKKQFFSELPFQFLEKKIHLIDGSAPKNPQKYWIEILNIYRNIEYWILDIYRNIEYWILDIYRNIEYWILDIYRNIEYWILDIYRNIEYGIYIEILNMEYISKYWILNVYQNIEYWICSSIAPELFKKCSDTTSGHIPPRKGLCAAACVNTCLKLGPCALRMPHWHWTFNYVLLTVPARTAVPAL